MSRALAAPRTCPCDVPMPAMLRRPQPWGRGVLAGRLSCCRDGLVNRPQASAWPDRRTLCREQVPLAPGEVDRSTSHSPRARCPQVPTSGLGVAPALCQPAAPMSSENLWQVLFSFVGLTVSTSWFWGAGGAVFFDPFSALSLLSLDFSIPPNCCRQAQGCRSMVFYQDSQPFWDIS